MSADPISDDALAGVRLDHVAVAVESWQHAWPRYVEELGGRWRSGGLGIGFGPAQLEFANRAKVEVLQPWLVDQNPFLRHFLDRSGPGPHHLTFKVRDLPAALERTRRHGLTPIGVDLSDPGWMEAFIHPREATGVVVQLAQAAADWASPPPEGFPMSTPAPATLQWVTHAVARLDEGRRLFVDLLGARPRSLRAPANAAWTGLELTWPESPLAVRLVSPAGRDDPLTDWIGGRSGRIHHLGFRLKEDGAIAGSHPGGGDVAGLEAGDLPTARVVAPDANFGVRLVVRSASPGESRQPAQ